MLYRSFIAAVLSCAVCQQVAGNAAADHDTLAVQQNDPAVVFHVADEAAFADDSLVIIAAGDVHVLMSVVYQGCMY